MATRGHRSIAIANAFSIYDGASGDCGLVKWCYNAARLTRMPWLDDEAEVVVWTNARGEDFVRGECGELVHRIVQFDASLKDLARRWNEVTATACKVRGRRCHLGKRIINNVAILKWQLGRHIEYKLIFLTDTDVDILDGHYTSTERLFLLHMHQSWATGLDALLGPSKVRQVTESFRGQLKTPVRYPNGTQLVVGPDMDSPLNAGVMLFKPSAFAYRRGIQALNFMQFNLTHGYELAGTSCAGLQKKTLTAFSSQGLRRCTWDFFGAATDQGLFWYVFAVVMRATARNRIKGYAVKHYWAYYKPWKQGSNYWCRRWFNFLDNATRVNRSGTTCDQQLFQARARVLALNASDGRNQCRGLWSRVF